MSAALALTPRPSTPVSAAVSEESFRAATRKHALWQHPFLGRCQTGRLSAADLRTLAGQMYKFSQRFSGFLGAILAKTDDEQAKLVIAENLWEELGEGDPKRTHPELFRRFTRALGIDDARLHRIPAEPETEILIRTYLDLPRHYGWMPAVGAVCYASEHIVSTLYSQLLHGIQGTVFLPKEALEFFRVHVVVDGDHARKLADLVTPRVTDTDAQKRVLEAIAQAMDARCRYFDGIERRIREREAASDRGGRPSQPPEVIHR